MADVNERWWESNKRDLNANLVASYKKNRAYEHRHASYRTFVSLYSNRDIANDTFSTAFNRTISLNTENLTHFSGVPFNIIKLMVDTVLNRVGKLKPLPQWVTDGGDYSLQEQAKRGQQYVRSVFHTEETYEKGQLAIRDALITGCGALKVYADPSSHKVCMERVYPGELTVNDQEAFHGEVRQLFQTKFISRHLAKALFPEKARSLETAGYISGHLNSDRSFKPTTDQIELVEAWHLPSVKGGTDGRHVISASDTILLDEPWNVCRFPFSFFRWSPEVRGFYGIGLAEELLGIHLDVNTSLEKVHRSIEVSALPMFITDVNAGISPKDISNLPGLILEAEDANGVKPVMPQAVPADVFQFLQSQIQRAYVISRLSSPFGGSTGGMPSGLETGAAVRNFHSVEQEAFTTVSQAIERFYMNVAENVMSAGKLLADTDPEFKVVTESDRNTIATVPWKEVHIDPDDQAYSIRVFPVSSLSADPAGRLADVGTMMDRGMITEVEALELLDFPDTTKTTNLRTAGKRLIEKILERMLDEGKYMAPEPFMDLELALPMAQSALLDAMTRDVPENRLELLRRFALQVSNLRKRAQEEQMAMQAGLQQNPAAPPPIGGAGVPAGSVTGNDPQV